MEKTIENRLAVIENRLEALLEVVKVLMGVLPRIDTDTQMGDGNGNNDHSHCFCDTDMADLKQIEEAVDKIT